MLLSQWLELEQNLAIDANFQPKFYIVSKSIEPIFGNLYVLIAGKRLVKPILTMFMVAPGKPAKDSLLA